jgi:Family of unknown function (DUF6338)
VIPDTLLGLLLFVGSIGPGYVWVLYAERRRPREERSAILEAAELAFVGVACTGASALAVLAVVNEWETLEVDTGRLVTEGAASLAAEPVRGLGTLLAILALSYGLALGAARLKYGTGKPVITGLNAWDEMFGLRKPEQPVYATAELRDGRCFAGWVYRWDAGSTAERRELTLNAPISMRSPGGAPTPVERVHFLTLHQDEIVWLSAAWAPPPTDATAPAN